MSAGVRDGCAAGAADTGGAPSIRTVRLDALARRMHAQQGGVRDLLEARLAALAAARAAVDPPVHAPPHTHARPRGRSPGPLAPLLAQLNARAIARQDAPAAATTAHVLDEMRALTTRARLESQVREALGQAPANAGPLNSASLVHRSLQLMHAQSPGYLAAFTAYVDELARLATLGLATARADEVPAPAAGKSKRRRSVRTAG